VNALGKWSGRFIATIADRCHARVANRGALPPDARFPMTINAGRPKLELLMNALRVATP
jgi:hypothetical protein